MPTARPPGPKRGLAALRRAGSVSDLLFLYECETQEVTGLRALAARLGLTVQAASHTYRGLARRGLVEVVGGRYRSTVKGVDWLHAALGSVRDDLAERLDRLHIVRTTQAVATASLEAGERVSLALRDGILTAAPGPARGSRGRARGPARPGDLVEVGELQGIVPLPLGRLRVIALPADRLRDPGLLPQLRATLDRLPPGLLLAFGLEAHHLIGRSRSTRTAVRFGVASAAMEATLLGVDCSVVAVDRELPRLFEQLRGPHVPPLEFLPLAGAGRSRRRARQ